MTAFEPHPDHRPTIESLPSGFDEADLRIDALLGECARQTVEPLGLRDRVFEASVSALPAVGEPALRLARSEDDAPLVNVRVRRRITWSRVAMAASVALAFGVGAIMFHNSPKPNSVMEVATLDTPLVVTPVKAAVVPSTTEVAALAMSEVNGLPAGSIDQLDGQMNYLLRTGDVTSLDDVRGELLSLVAALEL